MSAWSEVIVALRHKRGITQEQVADQVGVNVRTIRRWERGEFKPYKGAVEWLATALRVNRSSLEALVRGQQGMEAVVPGQVRTDRHLASEADHADMEQIAVMSAIAGGIHAMQYYKSALKRGTGLSRRTNPAAPADAAATLAIVRELMAPLQAWSNKRSVRFVIYGEELNENNRGVRSVIKRELASTNHVLARDAQSFRKMLDDGWIGILVDALDGVRNFDAQLPLFCSAVAIFDGPVPSVAAIYVPTENVVWFGSASIAGRAYQWHVETGMKGQVHKSPHTHGHHTVAIHLSRSDTAVADEFLPVLGAFVQDSDYKSTYMLNCGQLSLLYVATGALCCFANPSTSVWDVAAGEVLIRAMGGRVTDFSGAPINYGEDRIEVLAAEDAAVHDKAQATIEWSKANGSAGAVRGYPSL